MEKHQAIVGRALQILVEGPSRGLKSDDTDSASQPVRWSGRASSNHIVHFAVPDDLLTKKELLTGTFADIMIEGAHAHSLWGRLIRGPKNAAPGKGETTIAA